MSEHIILIGTYGWQHAQWDGEFYPDDLPVEWKIGYYGNEYPVVVVPNSYWQFGSEQYSEWLDESDDSLKFICEWPATGANEEAYQQARQAIASLNDRVAGVLIPVTTIPTDQEWQLIYGIAKDALISFDLNDDIRDDFIGELERLFPELDYGICWHGDQGHQEDLKLGRLAIGRIEQDRDPKELRRLLETMIATTGLDRTLVLIVDGSPPDMKLLTNAGIILDLL